MGIRKVQIYRGGCWRTEGSGKEIGRKGPCVTSRRVSTGKSFIVAGRPKEGCIRFRFGDFFVLVFRRRVEVPPVHMVTILAHDPSLGRRTFSSYTTHARRLGCNLKSNGTCRICFPTLAVYYYCISALSFILGYWSEPRKTIPLEMTRVKCRPPARARIPRVMKREPLPWNYGRRSLRMMLRLTTHGIMRTKRTLPS
jgi:hypothetical protein